MIGADIAPRKPLMASGDLSATLTAVLQRKRRARESSKMQLVNAIGKWSRIGRLFRQSRPLTQNLKRVHRSTSKLFVGVDLFRLIICNLFTTTRFNAAVILSRLTRAREMHPVAGGGRSCGISIGSCHVLHYVLKVSFFVVANRAYLTKAVYHFPS